MRTFIDALLRVSSARATIRKRASGILQSPGRASSSTSGPLAIGRIDPVCDSDSTVSCRVDDDEDCDSVTLFSARDALKTEVRSQAAYRVSSEGIGSFFACGAKNLLHVALA